VAETSQAQAGTPAGVPVNVRPQVATSRPEERGTLEVKTKALEHIVERVTLETPGTVVHASALGRLTGSRMPKADIKLVGNAARVDLDIAAVWPCCVTEIATGVRDRVLREAPRISGVDIRTVDVTVHMVELDSTDQPGRRVQ